MFFSTVIFGKSAYDWKITPTPLSRAGSSVTSLPCRITLPVYGISRPAMMRRIVVLPLPDAPSNTRTSPSPTLKLMFSSTLALPKRLLIPTTLAAASDGGALDAGSSGLGINVSFAFAISVSVDIQPVAREEQHAENQKRKQREHDRDRIRCFDLALVELREDIQRRRLCSSRKVSSHANRRAKLSVSARKSQQCTGDDRAPQGRQRHIPERLPARGADRC